jgi:hypothetical protein
MRVRGSIPQPGIHGLGQPRKCGYIRNVRTQYSPKGGFYEDHAEEDDDIVLRAFAPLGISPDDMRKARPLPSTMALREHAKINSGHEHGQVSREIMALMPPVSATTRARLRGQAVLFMELYRNFYDGILEYYSGPGHRLLRQVSSAETVEGGQL